MKLNAGMKGLVFGLISYVALTTSCSHDNEVPPTPIDNANPDIGGIMYDKYWSTEANFNQSDPNLDLYNDNANFFRCKQCHAWDGLGSGGSYISRAPSMTRPNVSSLNLYDLGQQSTAQELYDGMKKSTGRRDISTDLSSYDPNTNSTEGDKMPDYSQILTDAQIWDIVKFMKEGMIDVGKLYTGTYSGTYPTGSAVYNSIGLDGDADMGKAYYSANCAGCHGVDGTNIPLDDKGVGGFTRSKPYEVQHKTKFGQLGTSMAGEFDITDEEMKDLYKALSNSTDFPTDIPGGPVSYADDIQPFFDAQCTSCHKGTGIPLDLLPGVSYNNLLTGGTPPYVDISNPTLSLLYTKIAPGGSMAAYSNTQNTAMTLQWIEEGALDN
jgi:mono/diheme cytochrome c family protein